MCHALIGTASDCSGTTNPSQPTPSRTFRSVRCIDVHIHHQFRPILVVHPQPGRVRGHHHAPHFVPHRYLRVPETATTSRKGWTLFVLVMFRIGDVKSSINKQQYNNKCSCGTTPPKVKHLFWCFDRCWKVHKECKMIHVYSYIHKRWVTYGCVTVIVWGPVTRAPLQPSSQVPGGIQTLRDVKFVVLSQIGAAEVGKRWTKK